MKGPKQLLFFLQEGKTLLHFLLPLRFPVKLISFIAFGSTSITVYLSLLQSPYIFLNKDNLSHNPSRNDLDQQQFF